MSSRRGSLLFRNVRVCRSCDDASAAMRAACLRGDLASVTRASNGCNVNFMCPFARGSDLGGLASVHAAAASDNVLLLRYLVEEVHVPATLLTSGTPRKSVLRVALEHKSIDVLTYLTTHEAEDHALPLALEGVDQVKAPVLVNALASALASLNAKTKLLDQVLTDGAAAVPPPQVAPAPPAASSPSLECVCCFEALQSAGACALVPCGHANVCTQCAGALAECPVCRARIEKALRIFTD